MQPSVRHVSRTDLARNTRQVIDAVLRGQTVVVAHRGQPQVAIVDIVDYRIMRAAMRYHARTPEIAPLAGLAEERVNALSEPQERFDLVLAHYLAEAISLGRAAELLDIYRLDLQARFTRLDVPLRIGPATLEEARAEVEAALSLFSGMPDQDRRNRQAAIRAYTAGEISLGKAAELLGVSHEEMKEVLSKEGAEIHLGPETIQELLQDAANA